MPRSLSLFLLLLVIGCGEDKEVDTICDALCSYLVEECAYTAYPSMDSCTQGCLYNQAQGADVDGQVECIEDAGDCDTFALAECEHAYGD